MPSITIAIPDRLSADDPDFGAYADLMRYVDILVDGQIAKQVITYDVPAGWIERAVTDADDRLVVDEGTGDVAIERVNGVVSFAWRARG